MARLHVGERRDRRVTTLVCAVAGNACSHWGSSAVRARHGPVNSTILVRLVAPETATAVATLLLFTELGVALGNHTLASQ